MLGTNERNGPLLDTYLYFPGCLDEGDSEERFDNRILKLSSLESQGSVRLGALVEVGRGRSWGWWWSGRG